MLLVAKQNLCSIWNLTCWNGWWIECSDGSIYSIYILLCSSCIVLILVIYFLQSIVSFCWTIEGFTFIFCIFVQYRLGWAQSSGEAFKVVCATFCNNVNLSLVCVECTYNQLVLDLVISVCPNIVAVVGFACLQIKVGEVQSRTCNGWTTTVGNRNSHASTFQVFHVNVVTWVRIVGLSCWKRFHIFSLLTQLILVNSKNFSIGQGLDISIRNQWLRNCYTAICFALRILTKVASQRQGACKHTPQWHLWTRLGFVQTCNCTTIWGVTCNMVARTSQTVKTDTHHVEVVEAIYTCIHPQTTYGINTTNYTREWAVTNPVFASITCCTPAWATHFSTPSPRLVMTPFANVEYEGNFILGLALLVECSNHLTHLWVADFSTCLIVAEVILKHVYAPFVEQFNVLFFVSERTRLITFASHRTSIAVDTNLQLVVNFLQVFLQAADAFGEFISIVVQGILVCGIYSPTIVQNYGVETCVNQTMLLHTLSNFNHFAVTNFLCKPVPCQPSHHRCGRLHVLVNNEANLSRGFFFRIACLSLNGINVFAFSGRSSTWNILISVTNRKAVFFKFKAREVSAKVNTGYSFALVGHQFVNEWSTRKCIHQCGTRHRTCCRIDNLPSRIAIICTPEVKYFIMANTTRKVQRSRWWCGVSNFARNNGYGFVRETIKLPSLCITNVGSVSHITLWGIIHNITITCWSIVEIAISWKVVDVIFAKLGSIFNKDELIGFTTCSGVVKVFVNHLDVSLGHVQEVRILHLSVYAFSRIEELYKLKVNLIVGIINGHFSCVTIANIHFYIACLKVAFDGYRLTTLCVQSCKCLSVDGNRGSAGHTIAKECVFVFYTNLLKEPFGTLILITTLFPKTQCYFTVYGVGGSRTI